MKLIEWPLRHAPAVRFASFHTMRLLSNTRVEAVKKKIEISFVKLGIPSCIA